MKKLLNLLILFIGVGIISGCSSSDGQATLKIGTSPISNDVLEVAVEEFNENNEEYQIEIQMFDDAVGTNTALVEGSIDGTFHQHIPFLEEYNEANDTDLEPYGPEIFAFQIGLYSNSIDSLEEIEEGMTVAISNDPSNRGLALQLLERENILSLDQNVDIPDTLDITENPYNLEFLEMDRLSLWNAIDEVELVICLTDVVIENGADPADALAFMTEPGVIFVRDASKEWNDAFVEALTSDEVENYLNEEQTYIKIPLF